MALLTIRTEGQFNKLFSYCEKAGVKVSRGFSGVFIVAEATVVHLDAGQDYAKAERIARMFDEAKM